MLRISRVPLFKQYRFGYCDNEEQWEKWIKKEGCVYVPLSVGSGGTCQSVEDDWAIVTVPRTVRNTWEFPIYLSHECEHALIHIFRWAGESNPGNETRAHLMEWLMRFSICAAIDSKKGYKS